MQKPKSLISLIDPRGFAIIGIAIGLAIVVLLKPSLWEYLLILLIVDPISFVLADRLMPKIFFQLYPQARSFFNGIDESQFAPLNRQQRLDHLVAMLDFPQQYAVFCYVASFVKAIPTFLCILFYWQYERSTWLQFLFMIGIASTSYVYFYGLAFYDAREHVGRWIRQLHEKFDLREEFDALPLKAQKNLSETKDLWMQGFIICFSLILQLMVIFDGQQESKWELALKLIAIGAIGIGLSARIWYLSRREMVGGLMSIFAEMEKLDFNQTYKAMPLSASPLLAGFGQTFNGLAKRLAASEAELRQMIFHEAEKSRYETLGEISGLVVHDLSAPLQVTQYCLEELRAKHASDENKKYIDQMHVNVDQAIELVTSLRARLKSSPGGDTNSGTFEETHQHLWRLLETQFGVHTLGRIHMDLEPSISHLIFAIPRIDLMHILDNLYRNSILNLLEHKIENPQLRIHLDRLENNTATLIFADNGSGLTQEQFKMFTDEKNYSPQGPGRSLGLRLTRRLIEQHGGELTLLPSDLSTEPVVGSPGTRFRLTLKVLPRPEQAPLP